MNDREFFSSTACQYRIKALSQRVREFETGERDEKMQAEFRSVSRSQNNTIKKLKQELASAHAKTVSVRKNWSEIFDDLEAEHRNEVQSLRRRSTGLRQGFWKQRGKGTNCLTGTRTRTGNSTRQRMPNPH